MRKVNALVVVGVLLGLPVSTLAQNVRGVVAKEPDSVALRFVDAENGGRAAALTTTAVRAVAGIRLASREVLPPQNTGSERSWPARHPILFGTLVGAGAGAVVGGVLLATDWCGGDYGGLCVPAFSGAGAGLGAGVGLVVALVRR